MGRGAVGCYWDCVSSSSFVGLEYGLGVGVCDLSGWETCRLRVLVESD